MLLFSRNRVSSITKADLARAAGDWSAAAQHYADALARNPARPEIWVQYGHALKEHGRHPDAEAAYRRAIELAPASADAHLQLGHVLKLDGRRDEATAAYVRALTLAPSLDDVCRELAELGLDDSQIAAARDALPPLPPLRRRPSMITRADRALELGRWAEAARLYRQTLDRNPRNAPIWVQYGHVLRELGDLRAAETAYRRALAFDPKGADTYLQLGHALRDQGKSEKAQSAYLRALVLGPPLGEASVELSRLGWPQQSLAEVDHILRVNPHLSSVPREENPQSQLRPVFSVIIPVHDRTWELQQALDSVLSQSFPDFEIILVTNASPPETLNVINEYTQKDSRVRTFVYSDNSGNACRGRNRGIQEAQGTFISLLDSDDQYFPNTLEIVHNIIQHHSAGVVYGRAYFIVDGTRQVGNFVTGTTTAAQPIDFDQLLRGENPIQTCTVHIRRELLLRHGGFRPEQEYLEDLELWLRLARNRVQFYPCNELLAKYRFHQGNNELRYLSDREYWLEHLRNNYIRPFDDWGIGPVPVNRYVGDEKRPEKVPVWPGRVDVEWYLAQYSDVARSGADPLRHFLEYGRQEGRKPNPAEAKASGWRSVFDATIECRKTPEPRDETALFVTHSPDGLLKPHVYHYIQTLCRHGIAVTLIVAADKPFIGLDATDMDMLNGVFVRDNVGYDFAAWAHVIRLHPEIYNASTAYLVNDSVFGPLNDVLFTALLTKVRHSNADLLGLTESFERNWHIQSYFLALKSRLLVSCKFREFIESIVCYSDKEEVIRLYELRFATAMKIAGFKCESVYSKTDFNNPTITHWKKLLELGFPFLKVTTARDNYPNVDVSDWRNQLSKRGYDLSLADPIIAPPSVIKGPCETGSAASTSRQTFATLIFSHDLSESGAPRAAFNAARVLRDAGHSVVVASPSDGPIGERLRHLGVDVRIDELLLTRDHPVLDFAQTFDRVICNTIVCWPVVSQLVGVMNVYWWLHELEQIEQFVRDFPGFGALLQEPNVCFIAPSPLTAQALAKYGVAATVAENGVEDHANRPPRFKGNSDKLIIGTFGSYEPRKGQDLAVKGVLGMPPRLRSQVELRIFGRTLDVEFRNSIEQIAGNDSSIKFFDEISHDECLYHMAASDVVLTPSRDDPLPFVTLDALSFGKVLVCSSTTGTSAYLQDGKSGIILRENIPLEISTVLSQLVVDPTLRETLSGGSREVYGQTFTWDAFAARMARALRLDCRQGALEGSA